MDSPGPLEATNSSVEASTQRLEDLSLCDNPQGVEDGKRATDGLSQLGSTEPDSSPPHPNDPSQPVTLTPKEGYTRTVHLVRRVSCGEIVYCVSISPSGKLFAAGCERFTHVYTIETGHLLCTLDHGAAMYVKSVCFGPDESLIAAGDSNGTIRIGNMKDGSQHDWVAWDRDRVFSASLDGTLKEWQLNIAGGRYAAFEGAKCVRTYMGHGLGLSVGLMSDWILSCSGWEVLLRQRGSGSVENRLHGHEGRVMSVDGNPEHGIIVSGSKDGKARVWRLGKRPMGGTA
ncbi:hypothetical protein Purlil1_13323 [Purpureocillium lilacinum]|uniref:Uncharacterized protein n=1 Tax=Purpureocillium lilacinum TaxID=33203 RepID=A0ABR0BEE1_PURLI|nr:hypothetical protein Purlil1_13323 [Purpureocillium lilacinum]